MAADWMTRAACAGTDPDMWFPEQGTGATANVQVAACRIICGTCPVREDCLAEAMRAEGALPRQGRSGVYGGLTPGERHGLYRGKPPTEAVRKPPRTVESFAASATGAPCQGSDDRHGTRYGYRLGCRGVDCAAAGSAAAAAYYRQRTRQEATA